MRVLSVVVPVTRGEDGHAIRIRHAEVDRRAAEGKFAERVMGQQRQMGLSGAVVNHAQDALVRVDIGWSAAWDLRGHWGVDEDIAPRTNQTADGLARRVHAEDVFADSGRPARSALACGSNRRERAVSEQSVLIAMRQ